MKLNIEVRLEEMNTVLEALVKLPYEKVFHLINDIQKQCQLQINKDKELLSQMPLEEGDACAEQAVMDAGR